MRLDDKYLWCITQNFNKYSDICNVLTTIEYKSIGSFCKIFKAKENKDIIYIWLKGTELSIKDILVDMFFFKKKIDNGMEVHAGFWSATESIFSNIRRYLIDNARMNQKIVIFGHSLGAAMAKEVLRRLWEWFNNIECITFGTPRIGNKKYARYFNKFNITEYINRADIITKLPLRIMNYSHLSKEKIKYLGKWGISIKAHLNYGEYL